MASTALEEIAMTKSPSISALAAVFLAGALTACDRRDNPPLPKTASPEATARAAPGSAAPADRSAATVPATATAANEADRKFVKQAASSGIAEVEITQHTMDKASSDEVKKLARRLYQVHSQATQELMQIAGGKGMTLPAAPAPNQRAEVDQLRALTGAELDRTVLDKLDRWHRDRIKLFEREAKEGADAEVKAFAAKTLPTLREHLKMVESIRAAGGGHRPKTQQ
jgi:putative membrane protein